MAELESQRPEEQAEQAEAQGARSGPPSGFGKGVNDYLNQYITITDAKAAVLLAANIALAAAVLVERDVLTADHSGLLRGGVSSFTLSAIICAIVIFPRLPSGKTGLIFWEDILTRKDRTDYLRALSYADSVAVEREYASQNWFVSKVLHRKLRFVQWAVGTFVLGLALVGWWMVTR